VLEGVRSLAEKDVVPGGTKANLDWVRPHVRFGPSVDGPMQLVLADAQTNGGLLATVAAGRAEAVQALLLDAGVAVAHVGEVLATADGPGLEVA
jgi:selenide,water dikinase